MDMEDTVVYAIGDVHGCYKELLSLEEKIALDGLQFRGRKIIIMLGDYIDRGPQSARVLDHLLAPPPKGFLRVCLAGNHEVAMLHYLDGYLARDRWLAVGGRETLFSYGVDPARLASLYTSTDEVDRRVKEVIPASHIDFLRSLPVLLCSDKFVFVHAGIRPGIDLVAQDEHAETRPLESQSVGHGHRGLDVDLRPDQDRILVGTAGQPSIQLIAGGHHVAAVPDR